MSNEEPLAPGTPMVGDKPLNDMTDADYSKLRDQMPSSQASRFVWEPGDLQILSSGDDEAHKAAPQESRVAKALRRVLGI